MERLIKCLVSAPDWLRVRRVTVETEAGTETVSLDELERYVLPDGAFRLTVDVAPLSDR